MPETLFEIAQREKEIRYSSRTRLNTDMFRELQAIRRAMHHLRPMLPDELRENPDWRLLDSLGCDAAITIVQLIHRRAAYWTQSNDYEFSRYTVEEHWQPDATTSSARCSHPAWKNRTRPEDGVTILDLTRDVEPTEGTNHENRRSSPARLRHAADEPRLSAGPYRFFNREYLIITYRTDRAALEAVVPEPLTFDEPIVKYEFIRMPNSTGFGDYTESGQVIPVKFEGNEGSYTHAMFLNDGPPIYGGRELWGFPKKYAQPFLGVDKDTLIGTLDYGAVRIATGTMGFKHKALGPRPVAPLGEAELPSEDHSACRRNAAHLELVDYRLEDIVMKGAWTGPATLDLSPHALAPIAELPVREIISATHIVADLTLGLGKVVYDYLKK